VKFRFKKLVPGTGEVGGYLGGLGRRDTCTRHELFNTEQHRKDLVGVFEFFCVLYSFFPMLFGVSLSFVKFLKNDFTSSD
jgi:hypothetical protein